MGGGVFEVPLSMVRIVGGIILMRIGFSLFLPSAAASSPIADSSAGASGDVAFVPLAMPLMFGPGGDCHSARHGVARAASVGPDPAIGGDHSRHPGDDGYDLSS
jgi:hypothetical protein